MIAVLDRAGAGWGFVGMLHRQGFSVSWVVPCGADVGFDALPSAFRGVVAPLGFDDPSQLRTAVCGCEAVVLLGWGNAKSKELGVLAELDIPVFRAGAEGTGGYAVEMLDLRLQPTSAPKAAVTTLIRHVG